MKVIFLALVSVTLFAATTLAQSPTDKQLLERLEMGPGKVQALDMVLKKSDELPPTILRAAMLVAIQEKRIEDCAFLLYAGLFRADFDEQCFPPKGISGVGPAIVNSVSAKLLVQPITRAVMHQPMALANVIDRLKKWNPKSPKGYEPGYEFTERKPEKDAFEKTKPSRTKVLDLLVDCLILLNDPEYFAAFRVNQAFKFAIDDKKPTKVENDKATKTMKQIENTKGIKSSLIE